MEWISRFSPVGPVTRCALVTPLLVTILLTLVAGPLAAQEAQWIWSPAHEKDRIPSSSCHFRKSINLRSPQEGKVIIVADDAYELFINGRRMGTGQSTEKMVEYDVGRYLSRGRNIIAVKVSNVRGHTAALAARVLIQERDDEWRSYSTDNSWKTNLQPLPLWNTALYNDSRWESAQVFGQLGETPPWDIVKEEVAATTPSDPERPSNKRFKIADEFDVTQLIDAEKSGSLIAITFNEFGQVIAARENGPLQLIYDSDNDGTLDAVKPYCTLVKNCQGILALNGEVIVTAEGPEGSGVYRLSDANQDGTLDEAQAILKFAGKMGEHGPHAVALGPDGLLYVLVGNHAAIPEGLAASSPYSNWYEGDLIQPRYEDPTGHASGIKAPGGVVLRTDIAGRTVELFAGGLRNAYDLAFNREGDMFIHDSDMESDMGTSWYRPTRLFHVSAGAELGWRSGWATWPDYYVDAVPGVHDTGRGSPTGATFYNHFAFPARYHDVLFLADWSEGRILAVDVKHGGSSYTATSEVFLQGNPLNVTDVEVAPDGSLYFCTGGRGTAGGLYRVKWKGEVPASVANLGDGVGAIIRQPQFSSAWARQAIAKAKQPLVEQDKWEKQIAGVAKSTANPWYYRLRALQIMQLYGPAPSAELLIRLSEDQNEVVRAKAAELMGLHSSETTHARLIALLDDADARVRRLACEALLRAGQAAPVDKLQKPLASEDRHEAIAARRLLEQTALEDWRSLVLSTTDHRVFIQGALALVIAYPSEENSLAVLNRFAELMDNYISDRNFLDMLRVAQVALQRAPLQPQQVETLASKLGEEFPSSDAFMNRELMRLLAHLQVTTPMSRYLAFLKSDAPEDERLHVALQLRFLSEGWPAGQRLELIKYLEEAKRRSDGGEGYRGYLSSVERDVARFLSPEEGREVLLRGAQWPAAATGALYGLPKDLDPETLTALTRLDEQLLTSTDDAAKMLRIGIVAVLARSGQDEAFAYLRQAWDREPERRDTLAMGLSQQPAGDNWPYLVRSLPVVQGHSATEVLKRLASVNATSDDAESIRQVILCGLRLGDPGASSAIALLEHWTGEKLLDDQATSDEHLKAWQEWYADEFPQRPRAELPTAPTDSKWAFDELLAHLTDASAVGSKATGAAVFEKAQCAKCHRFGKLGENLGPDLTSLAKRFSKREVLESILFPSHVISDQYAAKTVVTTSGRTYTGLVLPGVGGDKVVLQSNGEPVSLRDSDIEDIVPSTKSNMPDNLLDPLTLEEISDLFAFLGVLPMQAVARQNVQDEKLSR